MKRILLFLVTNLAIVHVLSVVAHLLAAGNDYDPRDLYDVAFLEPLAAAAIKITIGEGEKKVQDLTIKDAGGKPGPS